jgi:hypothetical protein
MTTRIYLGSDRVTISKPGFDAENPPAVDYKYLALDSRLNIGRPLEIGTFTMGGNPVVSFSTTYQERPAVDIVRFSQISSSPVIFSYAVPIVMQDTAGGVTFQRTPFNLVITRSTFQIADDWRGQRSQFILNSGPAFYIVWQTW